MDDQVFFLLVVPPSNENHRNIGSCVSWKNCFDLSFRTCYVKRSDGKPKHRNKLKGEIKFPKKTSKKHRNLEPQGHSQILLCWNKQFRFETRIWCLNFQGRSLIWTKISPHSSPTLLYFLWGNRPLYGILELEDFFLILFSLNIFFLKKLTSQHFPQYILLLSPLQNKRYSTVVEPNTFRYEDTVPRSSAIFIK